MAVKPIDLPSAAGIDYSGGDVRHFAQGDAVNVPGLSNPTRNLAERDNQLAQKVNELVSVVNNQEQFVPLPVVRTTVPPNDEVIVTNYRIPNGFEARVLNAAVNSIPGSTYAELDVLYSASYGGSTGTAIVTSTPSSEFTGDVNFYQTGEFIVVLKNRGSATLEIAASIMLTMRPLGAEGTLLVGSVIVGPEGKVGMTGPPGPPGIPGTGGAGSPGMLWRSTWTPGTAYQTNDVVSFSYSGTYGSWICRASNTAILGVNDPEVDAVTWNAVAYGITGATGVAGGTGPAGGVPTYFSTIASGTLETGLDWAGITVDGYMGGAMTPGSVYYIPIHQHYIESASGSPKGYAWLQGVANVAFRGSGTITLPKAAYGAKMDFLNSYIDVVAIANGTAVVDLSGPGASDNTRLCTCIPKDTDKYVIKVLNGKPVWIAFLATGMQPIP